MVRTRRGLLLGMGAALLAGPAFTQQSQGSLRPLPRPTGLGQAAPFEPEALIAKAKLSGKLGYIVMDSASAEVLASRNANDPMPPASMTKAVTAAYALDKLGPDFRFVTRILANGPLEGGIVQGDLILAGGGDPTLQTDQLGDLAKTLAARGIKGVKGAFYIYEGALPRSFDIASDQPVHVGYNPSVSGLNLNYNRVYFEWKKVGSDWSVAMQARGERFSPNVSLARMTVQSRQAPLFTYKSGPIEEWTVANAALGKGGSRWLPIRQAGLYAGEVFQSLMGAQGIRLPAPQSLAQVPQGQELGRIESAPLPDVLREMLRWSTNLTAEALGLTASQAPNIAQSAQSMNDWLTSRFGVQAQFADHSGLGSKTRISPAAMAQFLRLCQIEGLALRPLLRDTPMRGKDGKPAKNHPAKIRAKSGTLNFVTTLGGYIASPRGRDLIFVYMSADPERRDALAIEDRENPAGSKAWAGRSLDLQGQLIAGWASAYE